MRSTINCNLLASLQISIKPSHTLLCTFRWVWSHTEQDEWRRDVKDYVNDKTGPLLIIDQDAVGKTNGNHLQPLSERHSGTFYSWKPFSSHVVWTLEDGLTFALIHFCSTSWTIISRQPCLHLLCLYLFSFTCREPAYFPLPQWNALLSTKKKGDGSQSAAPDRGKSFFRLAIRLRDDSFNPGRCAQIHTHTHACMYTLSVYSITTHAHQQALIPADSKWLQWLIIEALEKWTLHSKTSSLA